MKVGLLGSTGFLGSYLISDLNKNQFEVVTIGRSIENDIVIDFHKMYIDYILDFDIVINLIGSTDVDRCEESIEYATSGNIQPILFLRDQINLGLHKKKSIPYFLNISSDQVYSNEGLNNESQAAPINNYSMTKFIGETILSHNYCCSIRTNFFGASDKSSKLNLAEWIIEELSKNRKIELFSDVIFNPLYIESLSDFILKIITKKPKGIFNLGSQYPISKYHFGKILASEFSLDESLIIESNLSNMLILNKKFSNRPKNMSMDCSKFQQALSLDIPDIKDEIKKFKNNQRSS